MISTHAHGEEDIGEKVAAAVLAQHAALPKTGKPQPNEHTVLAGFVLSWPSQPHAVAAGGKALPGQSAGFACEEPTEPTAAGSRAREDVTVVALGTGTKCLGAGRRSCRGDVLNDSHAEVRVRPSTCLLTCSLDL